MFAIGDRDWPGLSKLVEESGEVNQVIGKLMGTRGNIHHWSVPDLRSALEDELADLGAAIKFVEVYCSLNIDRIKTRSEYKFNRFIEWHNGDQKL